MIKIGNCPPLHVIKNARRLVPRLHILYRRLHGQRLHLLVYPRGKMIEITFFILGVSTGLIGAALALRNYKAPKPDKGKDIDDYQPKF